MMDLVEEMEEKIAMDLHGKTEVEVGDNIINFQRPWKRYTMYEAIEHFTGIDISKKAITISNKLYKSDNVNFIWGDAEDLQFENCQFDLTFLLEAN